MSNSFAETLVPGGHRRMFDARGTGQLLVRSKDGAELYVELTLTPIDNAPFPPAIEGRM